MVLSLFNTLTRQKQEFKPLHDNEAGVYTCGPTVYNFAHLGNLRAYIFADILKRTLLHAGYKVKHIMNITDVGHLTGDRDMGEDKIEKAATQQRKTAWEIASFYTDAFLHDLKELNILLPDRMPKATDHIKEMIKLIEALEKNGFTYRTADGIYFDTSKLKDYGKLAQLDIMGLKEGARVEINPEKKNPTDFALWKLSNPKVAHPEALRAESHKKRDMEWSSPWGIGFPGWHIECSAMSTKYLGQPFDIHTGGIDHVPVHHTNEIAQSEGAFAVPLANFWLHNEHLLLGEARIGKSEGNLITLRELKDKGYSPLALRYFVLGAHYRSKLKFSWEALGGAQNALDNLLATISDYAEEPQTGCAEFEREFLEAINDDLDTPKALAVMWNLVRSQYPPKAKLESLFKFDQVLGLSLRETREELRKPLPEDIHTLVTKRERERQAQNWTKADDLRKAIESRGFEIRDTEKGPLVRRKL